MTSFFFNTTAIQPAVGFFLDIRPMNPIKRFCFILILTTVFFSCKKNAEDIPEPLPEVETIKRIEDSLSFTIDGASYIMSESFGRGVGNTQINLKPYNDVIPGREPAVITGGKYFYGEKDSILYFSNFELASQNGGGSKAELFFTRKFAKKDLQPDFHVMYPKDQSEVIKVGKQSFAEDFEKENTQDGIVLKLSILGKSLTSSVPGFSILKQSHMKNIQQNSIFEITKVEKVRDDVFVLEAKFTMNVFDDQLKLYRLENGYLRKLFFMSHNLGFIIN